MESKKGGVILFKLHCRFKLKRERSNREKPCSILNFWHFKNVIYRSHVLVCELSKLIGFGGGHTSAMTKDETYN